MYTFKINCSKVQYDEQERANKSESALVIITSIANSDFCFCHNDDSRNNVVGFVSTHYLYTLEQII